MKLHFRGENPQTSVEIDLLTFKMLPPPMRTHNPVFQFSIDKSSICRFEVESLFPA